MRSWLFLLLAGCVLMVSSGPAWAHGGRGDGGDGGGGSDQAALSPTGTTLGGPLDTRIGAGITKTVFSSPNGPVTLGCVTVENTGSSDVSVALVGTLTTTFTVAGHDSSVACESTLHAITINCLAAGNASCHVSWRLDGKP